MVAFAAVPPIEFQAAILGVVQGICEFLPISSSAHLVALPKLLGWPYLGKGFDVALHLGTLGALLAHFREDLGELWRGSQRLLFSAGPADDPQARLAKQIVVASIPAALVGFFLDDIVEPCLQGLLPIALLSIVWGGLLGWSDRFTNGRTVASLSLKETFLVGWAQAMALLPGTSRSGVVMTATLFLGLSRPEAARFSLLLSIPVIAGAALLKAWVAWSSAPTELAGVFGVGILTSALTGAVCLKNFLPYLERGDFRPFALYRVLFGMTLLYCLLTTGY